MKKMLQYQKLEMELRKIQRSINQSEEKNVMNKMINYVKEAQGLSNQIENKASKLVADYLSLKQQYDANSKKVQKLIASTPSSEEELKSTYAQVNKLSSELFMIERNVNIVITKAKEALKEFETTKNNVIKARSRHKVSKENYEKLVAETEPKMAEIKKQMKTLEGALNPALFDKYKSIKNDSIFPVFVPLLNNKSCYGCRMELASSTLNKLANEPYVTCEHCGRLIVKNEK